MAGFLSFVVCLLGCVNITFATDGYVTLLGGTPYTGRVSIELNGTRGAVCSSGFAIEEGNVVCRQLGFSYGALRVVPSSQVGFGVTAGQAYTHNLQCNGSEASLTRCVGATWSLEPSCQTAGQDEVVVYCALPFYEGCYDSSNSDGTSLQISMLTWADLVSVCRATGNQYIAFSTSGNGDRCYMDQQPFNTRVDDSQCANTCSDDRNLLCGGADNYRAIYSTNLGAPGFDINSDTGTITSPKYPDPYDENQMNEWTVTLNGSLSIRVSFAVFDLQSGDNVTFNYNGVSEIFTMGRTWISDPTTSFTIQFVSGGSAGSGFILNYEVYVPTTTQAATTPAPTTTPSPTTTPPATTAAPPTTSTTSEAPSTAAPTAPPSTPSSAQSSSDAPVPTADVTTDAPPQSPTTPSQGTTPSPSTGGAVGSTDNVIQTTQDAATPPATTMMKRAPNEVCPASFGEANDSWRNRDLPFTVVINTGNPLSCYGTGVSITYFAISNTQFELGVWRRFGNAYQLVDNATIPANPNVTLVTLDLSEVLIFEEGDFLGFAFRTLSPLVYASSSQTPTPSNHSIWNYPSLSNFPDLTVGELLTNETMTEDRAYALELIVEDAKCQVLNVTRGQLSPQQAEVVQGTEVSLTCDDGYEASVTMATCLSNRSFDVVLTCSRVVPFFRNLELPHFVILLVAVGLLGMFVLGITCAMVFWKKGAKAEPPERDMADGAEKGLNRRPTETTDSEAYLLPISMDDNAGNDAGFDSYGAGNGFANPAFATDAHGVENGIANNQAIEMNGNTNIPEDTPNIAETAPDQIPEPPSLPAEEPAVPDVQQSGPEIPAPDYDPIPDEEIPPPPSEAPPPPPPPPPDEPSPPPGALNGSAASMNLLPAPVNMTRV